MPRAPQDGLEKLEIWCPSPMPSLEEERMPQASSKLQWLHDQRGLRTLLVASLAGILCYCLGARLTIVPVAMAQDKVVPFVLKAEIYAYEHDPKGALAITRTFARRSDGATVMVESLGPITLGITGRRVAYWDGTSRSFVDAFRTKTTEPAVPLGDLASYHAHLLNAPPNCLRHGGRPSRALQPASGNHTVLCTRAAA